MVSAHTLQPVPCCSEVSHRALCSSVRAWRNGTVNSRWWPELGSVIAECRICCSSLTRQVQIDTAAMLDFAQFLGLVRLEAGARRSADMTGGKVGDMDRASELSLLLVGNGLERSRNQVRDRYMNKIATWRGRDAAHESSMFRQWARMGMGL